MMTVMLIPLAIACGGGSDVSITAVTGGTTEPTAESATTETPGTPVPLPDAPDNPLTGGTLVASYLAANDADLAGCLPELVDRWQLEPTEGLRCLSGDLDGDREDEFAFLITAPGGDGDVWFFDDAEAGRRLISSARVLANDVLTDITIVAGPDLTGDRQPDAVITATACGGETCETRLLIASGHLGVLADVTPDDLDLGSVEEIRVADGNGDGIDDLIIEIGRGDGDDAPTAAASPPRDAQLTLHWSGVSFFVDTEGADGAYLIYAIVDADRLYRAGDHTAARDAYVAAATDSSLLDWHAELGTGRDRTELVPYAYFRAALAAIGASDRADGVRLLRTAIIGHEASVHGEAAASFEVGFTNNLTFAQSCEFATTALSARAAEFDAAWDFGPDVIAPAISGICR